MRISFLVTYYNQVSYVRESLESILALDKGDDWEILVGDDGSQDGTQEAVRAYMARYPGQIRLHVMERDRDRKYDSVLRASANRLALLSRAAGDCICFLDGDDVYTDRDFPVHAMEVLATHPEVTVVAHLFHTFGEDGGAAPKAVRAGEGYVRKSTYLRGKYVPAGACVMRREADPRSLSHIAQMGYYDDNNIVLHALSRGEMYFVPRDVYGYRQTGNSVYAAMGRIEQAALNVQGMGADLAIMGERWKRDLQARYAHPICALFLARNRLTEVLGEEKTARYLEGTARTGFAEGIWLFRYPLCTAKEKRELWRYILGIAAHHPLRALSAWVHSMVGSKQT
ncbi:MAG: glycosyltransferase family 2 protein [Clostridia bacterium]|nr:glycosyltransferase family 2 protein [Clostridia bacterium]